MLRVVVGGGDGSGVGGGSTHGISDGSEAVGFGAGGCSATLGSTGVISAAKMPASEWGLISSMKAAAAHNSAKIAFFILMTSYRNAYRMIIPCRAVLSKWFMPAAWHSKRVYASVKIWYNNR